MAIVLMRKSGVPTRFFWAGTDCQFRLTKKKEIIHSGISPPGDPPQTEKITNLKLLVPYVKCWI